jgi:hypothetical protein
MPPSGRRCRSVGPDNLLVRVAAEKADQPSLQGRIKFPSSIPPRKCRPRQKTWPRSRPRPPPPDPQPQRGDLTPAQGNALGMDRKSGPALKGRIKSPSLPTQEYSPPPLRHVNITSMPDASTPPGPGHPPAPASPHRRHRKRRNRWNWKASRWVQVAIILLGLALGACGLLFVLLYLDRPGTPAPLQQNDSGP